MTKFEDLPNELLSKVIAILGEPSLPYGSRKSLPALISLCRVSKRFCELARCEIYSTAEFNDIYSLLRYFVGSGLSQCPLGTLRKVCVAPRGDDSFLWLERGFAHDIEIDDDSPSGLSKGIENVTARVRKEATVTTFGKLAVKYCTSVQYLEIYLSWLDSDMYDNYPEYYTPLFKAMNPKSIIYNTGFSPADMVDHEVREPSIQFSKLLDIFSTYTRLAYLRLPAVHFDKLETSEVAILAKLPLEYLRFDWPSQLTKHKLYAIMDVLPKLQKKAFVVSSRRSRMGMEMDDGVHSRTESHFDEHNWGLTLSDIQAFLKEKNREDLLERLFWEGPSELEEGLEDR